MKTLGLIAGNGKFPFLVAREARSQGLRVVIAGLEKEADPELSALADRFTWVKIGALANLVKFFKAENAQEVVMAGKVEKVKIFQSHVRPDLEMVKVLLKTRDFKDDSLLGGIADYLEKQGIRILDSTAWVSQAMPQAGVLGKIKPSKDIWEDIRFGYHMAKHMAGLDVGQTVVVKKKAVIAVEAIEGTDLAIQRGGELAGGGVTVVKVAKPKQDLRFDVPAVGLATVQSLIQAKALALAFEAGKTIFLEQEAMIREADRAKIVLIGITEKDCL